jgi:arsenate reductase-like glutaredoxin family protein
MNNLKTFEFFGDFDNAMDSLKSNPPTKDKLAMISTLVENELEEMLNASDEEIRVELSKLMRYGFEGYSNMSVERLSQLMEEKGLF